MATALALRRCIERMQLLQIDTIHVVARSPYLVLFSRLGDYPVQRLDQALAKGHLFESWAHETCLAPMADLALHRSYNLHARRHWGIARGEEDHARQRVKLDALLARIEANGAVKSSDFERSDGESGGWWGWKDEKRWLEALFAKGELMVARRENFQRVYDLAHRVCPALTALALPTAAEVHQRFIEKSILALGITQARWVHDYFRIKPRLKDTDLDPLVWDRERALAMFDFAYRIECYTPQAKRTYGYFVLPILHRAQLIGRLDAKAHRTQGVFEVKALFLESGIQLDSESVYQVARAIHRCAAWHATPKVELARTSPVGLRARLRKALQSALSDISIEV